MAVEMIRKEIQVPRNVDEIRVLIVGLLEDIVQKKELQALIAENLQPLLAAIEGIDKLSEEAKSKEVYNVAALLAADVIRVLTAPKPAPAPAPAA
jgi:hypothetical protein